MQVIAAKGEQKASGALRAAAETMEQAPAALQLRFLQVSLHCLEAATKRLIEGSFKKLISELSYSPPPIISITL